MKYEIDPSDPDGFLKEAIRWMRTFSRGDVEGLDYGKGKIKQGIIYIVRTGHTFETNYYLMIAISDPRVQGEGFRFIAIEYNPNIGWYATPYRFRLKGSDLRQEWRGWVELRPFYFELINWRTDPLNSRKQ